MNEPRHILVTGGAGYIGSLLVGELLRAGDIVTVVDSLLYSGESLLGYFAHPNFHFSRADVTEPRAVRDSLRRDWPRPSMVVHLAAVVGFPACQAIGPQAAWAYNVEATKLVFEQAASLGAERFLFASSYSNYGFSEDGQPVSEESNLHPQSLYAETKMAAEEFLLSQKETALKPVIFRMATLFGLSPRTRFDLIVNQFVLDAYFRHELIIYQRGYSRSFLHVRDAVRGLMLGMDAPGEKVGGQIFNLGDDAGNLTKDQIVALVLKRLPETVTTYKDLTFGGDVRDITASFAKIRRELGFQATLSVDSGVRELVFALRNGLFRNPLDEKYRNGQFVVQ